MEGFWFFWFLMCIGIGVFAHNKNRSGIGWFILAFIFSPLIAGVILACQKDLRVDEDISRVKMEQQHLKDRVVSNEKLTDYRLNRVELDVNHMQNRGINYDNTQNKQISNFFDPKTQEMYETYSNMSAKERKDSCFACSGKVSTKDCDTCNYREIKLQEYLENKSKNNAQQYKNSNTGTKLCPACVEVIKAEAIKCKHCGIMVDSIKVVDCPYCFESILATDTSCRHCKSDLSKMNIDVTSLKEVVAAKWDCLCGKISQGNTCHNCGRAAGAMY